MTGSLSMSEGWRNARSWCALLTLVTVFAGVRGHNWMGGGWRYPLWSTGDSSEEMSVLHAPGYSSYARAGYNTGYNNGYNTRYNHNYPGQPSNPGYGRLSWYGYNNHPVGVGWGQQNSGGSAMSGTAWGHGLGSKSGDSSAQGGASAGRFAGGDSSSEDDTTSFLGGLLAGLGGGGSSNKERYPLTSEILAGAGGGNDGSQSADVSLASSDDEGDVSDDVADVVVGGRQAEDRGDSNSSEGDDVGDNDSRGSDRSGLHVASYPTINCQAAMDVAVLVDLSQRASAPDVTQVRTSLGDLVDNLHVQSGGRHMAVMTYGSQVRLTSALSGNAGQLKTDIARLTPAGGAADMALALQSMRDLLTSQGRPSVSKACVLITDERATSSQMAARQAALARMAGIQMLVVAVGQDLDVGDLRQVADDDDYHLLFAEGYLDLVGLTSLISSTLCSALRTSARPATSATKTLTRIPQTSPILTSKQTVRPTTLIPPSRPVSQNPSTSSSRVPSAKTSSGPIKSTQWTTSEKITSPSTQRPTPSTQRPTPSTQKPIPSTQRPIPSTQRPTPSTQRPIPSTQRPTPSTQRPIPSTQRPTPSTQRPTPSTQRPTPSTQRPTPSTQRPTPSTQRPTPSTQRPTPSTQRPTPSTQRPTPSTQRPTPSTQRPTPSTQRPTPSTKPTTPKQVTTQRPSTPPTTRRTFAPSTPKLSTSTPHVTPEKTTASPTQRPSTPRVTPEKTAAPTTQRPTRASTPTVTSPVPEQTTMTQRIPEICDGCTMVNGVGYKAHWSACDLFVQCVIAADGSATVSIRQCPHGLHWDQAALTCNRPSLAACPQDMCRQPGYIVYPATSNCRGFWACEGGVSEGKCCPPGFAFSMDGECVPSPSCQDPCGVAPTITNVCDKRAVATMPLVFEQYVAGEGWQLMFCAPGTAYNHSQCACTDPNPAAFEPPECRAELYIPFNDGEARDESGNNNFVQNDGVKVSGGVGYFDGSAVLRVPRFSNSDYGDVLLVRLRYKQDTAGTPSSSQALVANGDCLKPSSLYLAADHQGVHFGVRTSTGQSPTVVVPELSVGWKEAVLYIDRQLLTGSVNNFSKQTLFTGSLDSSKCALQIGRGTNFQNFKGLMDDITVYLCRPKTL